MLKNIVEEKNTAKVVKAYIWIFVGALIYTLGLQGFLQHAKTFSSGLAAFATLPTFVIDGALTYVSLIYLVINIPLILFYWKKNKRRFMNRTCFYLISQGIISSFFFIPQVKSLFTNLLAIEGDISQLQWPIFILALIGAFLMGFGIAICWRYGGSTAGTDIITYYYSTKKQVSVRGVMFIVGTTMTIFSFAITIILNEEIRGRWLMTLFSTLMFVFITTEIVNLIYPKYKKVQVSIVSDHHAKISSFLKENNYWHSWTITKTKSGYTNKERIVIKSVMFLLETKDFIREIKAIDHKAFITSEPIIGVEGNMFSKWID